MPRSKISTKDRLHSCRLASSSTRAATCPACFRFSGNSTATTTRRRSIRPTELQLQHVLEVAAHGVRYLPNSMITGDRPESGLTRCPVSPSSEPGLRPSSPQKTTRVCCRNLFLSSRDRHRRGDFNRCRRSRLKCSAERTRLDFKRRHFLPVDRNILTLEGSKPSQVKLSSSPYIYISCKRVRFYAITMASRKKNFTVAGSFIWQHVISLKATASFTPYYLRRQQMSLLQLHLMLLH